MTITIKTAQDIEYLKVAGQRLAAILTELEKMVAPGVSTADLNQKAIDMVAQYGDESAFLHYTPEGANRPYPSALCVSINNEIVHGISNEDPTIIKEGDVVSIDMGVKHNGMIVDSARTVIAGRGSKKAIELLRATKEALYAGIMEATGGNRVGDIGFAIQSVAKKHGLSIADGLAGHGVGYHVHEDPYVPNKGKKGVGEELVPGMVIAIEPMFNIGDSKIVLDTDGYTYKTADGSLSAHFEHTVLITEGEPVILTE